MTCDICGASEAKRKARIEGAVVTVCEKCVSLGEEIPIESIHKLAERMLPKLSLPAELELVMRPDAGEIIKREREKRGLTQAQLAEKILEKLSVIKRAEEGWQPPLSVVRKLEKVLGVSLLETSVSGNLKKKIDRKQLTIGDVAEVST
ncbi:MAG: multiprotein-bridging factor 1 family protein [Candidatus Aenigmatarchaeota archaeon]|nr:TIGR00270 family protein [Candidatus Aenigmarchaeota archaeon]